MGSRWKRSIWSTNCLLSTPLASCCMDGNGAFRHTFAGPIWRVSFFITTATECNISELRRLAKRCRLPPSRQWPDGQCLERVEAEGLDASRSSSPVCHPFFPGPGGGRINISMADAATTFRDDHKRRAPRAESGRCVGAWERGSVEASSLCATGLG